MDEAAAQIGTGMVQGGWEYITAVYIVTWGTLVGLAIRAIALARLAPQEAP